MNEPKMIPWDVIIEILNKYQSYNPGLAAERINKFVNDEIYEWVYNQEPEPVNESKDKLETIFEQTEYWAGKNGYEQEALNGVLSMINILIKDVYK